jgi:hypothetical protein
VLNQLSWKFLRLDLCNCTCQFNQSRIPQKLTGFRNCIGPDQATNKKVTPLLIAITKTSLLRKTAVDQHSGMAGLF